MAAFWQAIIMIVVRWFLDELNKKNKEEVEELGEKAGKFANGFKKNFDV